MWKNLKKVGVINVLNLNSAEANGSFWELGGGFFYILYV